MAARRRAPPWPGRSRRPAARRCCARDRLAPVRLLLGGQRRDLAEHGGHRAQDRVAGGAGGRDAGVGAPPRARRSRPERSSRARATGTTRRARSGWHLELARGAVEQHRHLGRRDLEAVPQRAQPDHAAQRDDVRRRHDQHRVGHLGGDRAGVGERATRRRRRSGPRACGSRSGCCGPLRPRDLLGLLAVLGPEQDPHPDGCVYRDSCSWRHSARRPRPPGRPRCAGRAGRGTHAGLPPAGRTRPGTPMPRRAPARPAPGGWRSWSYRRRPWRRRP